MQLWGAIFTLQAFVVASCVARTLPPHDSNGRLVRLHPRDTVDTVVRSIKLQPLRFLPRSEVIASWAMQVDISPSRPEHEGFMLGVDTGSHALWVASTLLPEEQQLQSDPGSLSWHERKMYIAPEDECDPRYFPGAPVTEYGSSLIHTKVLRQATITAESVTVRDFPVGLAKSMSDAWVTNPEHKTGHGLMGMSRLGFPALAFKAGLVGTGQFLFDGRDGRLLFGEFGEGSGHLGWVKVTENDENANAWTVSAEDSNLGLTLFDTGAQGIYVRESNFLEYFRQDGWAAGHVHSDDRFYIDCDILRKPDVRVPHFQILLRDHTKERTNEFLLDPKWLIGDDSGKVDAAGNRWCECLLKRMPPDDSMAQDTELGIPFFRQFDVVFDAGTNGNDPKIGVRSHRSWASVP